MVTWYGTPRSSWGTGDILLLSLVNVNRKRKKEIEKRQGSKEESCDSCIKMEQNKI